MCDPVLENGISYCTGIFTDEDYFFANTPDTMLMDRSNRRAIGLYPKK